ncbi:hypothetical protein Tco_0531266 [Tanacetum coccineum]
MDAIKSAHGRYIKLELKKLTNVVRRLIAMYGKVRLCENIEYRDFKTDFPAIIYDDALTTDHEFPHRYTTVRPLDNNEMDFRISLDESDDEDYICIYDKSSFSYKLIYVNDLKMDSEKDIDEVNLPRNDVGIEQLDNDIYYNVDTQSYEFDEVFETNHDVHGETFNMEDYLIIEVMIQKCFHKGMPLIFVIKNLYVPFGIPFDPKWFNKDGVYTKKIEEVHGLRKSMGEQRDVLDAMSRDFSLFTVWAVSSLSQLIDLSGVTYTRYFDSYVPYQRRRVRLRTNDASTSAPQQPDP